MSGISHLVPIASRAKPDGDEHVLDEFVGESPHNDLATNHRHHPRAVTIVEGLERVPISAGDTVEEPAGMGPSDKTIRLIRRLRFAHRVCESVRRLREVSTRS